MLLKLRAWTGTPFLLVTRNNLGPCLSRLKELSILEALYMDELSPERAAVNTIKLSIPPPNGIPILCNIVTKGLLEVETVSHGVRRTTKIRPLSLMPEPH